MSEEITKFSFPKRRFAGMIYSSAGTGKTISAMTALKVPNLNVRILCTEANALTGVEEALSIHGITDLREGQLTIAIPDADSATSADAFMTQETDAFYQSIISKIMMFKGQDVATGKQVNLGKVMSWKNDSLFILDGMTMFESACSARGRKVCKETNVKDARMAFYKGQDALVGGLFQIVETSGCHVLVLAHQTMSDEVQQEKHKLSKGINPGFGTRSVIDKLAGRFSSILYMRYNQQQKKYVWSAEEKDAYTISRGIDRTKLKALGVNLSNLPADFSHELYNFF